MKSMPTPSNRPIFQELMDQAAKLAESRDALNGHIARAQHTGDLISVRAALDELQLETKEFDALREKIVGSFVERYLISTHHWSTVSLIIPEGCSALDFLVEAQFLSRPRSLFQQSDVERWRQDPNFTTRGTEPISLRVAGISPEVPRHQMPTVAELAVACTAFSVATGGANLLGWTEVAGLEVSRAVPVCNSQLYWANDRAGFAAMRKRDAVDFLRDSYAAKF
jgi:hypothetical protein